MPRHITGKSFYKFIKCPAWVYFDASKGEIPHDPLLARLIDDKLLPEIECEIIGDRPDIAEVTAEDPEEAFRQTLEFMREGRETIYRGALVHGHWVGMPDIIAKVEGRSRFGDYYYVAADIKRSRIVKDDYKFQGCFYAELLGRLQGTKPVQGYVITPDRKTLAYLIEEFEAEYKLTLSEMERVAAGEKPPHFMTSGCKQSPWFSECRRESESCDDVSMLNCVWREEVARLRDAGVVTLKELAATPLHKLERRTAGLRPGRLEFMRDQAVAIVEGRHIIRGPVSFPEARVELFFDIESDPLRDFDYLFGVLEASGGETKYHAFMADRPEDEGKAWREFVEFVESRFDAPIYHYGWFEIEVVRRFAAKYGISETAREALERNMIDLLYLIRPAVIFPLPFYSLKDIAGYLGFKWRSEDASGANSVLWFEKYLKRRDKRLLKKILDYNEDDVRATFAVQRWVREQTLYATR